MALPSATRIDPSRRTVNVLSLSDAEYMKSLWRVKVQIKKESHPPMQIAGQPVCEGAYPDVSLYVKRQRGALIQRAEIIPKEPDAGNAVEGKATCLAIGRG